MMSVRNLSLRGSPQDISCVYDLWNDITGITPDFGVKKSLSIWERFLARLSKMTDTAATTDSVGLPTVFDINIYREARSDQSRVELDEELKQFLTSIETELAIISTNRSGEFIPYLPYLTVC
jgi:hypothetical protein